MSLINDNEEHRTIQINAAELYLREQKEFYKTIKTLSKKDIRKLELLNKTLTILKR